MGVVVHCNHTVDLSGSERNWNCELLTLHMLCTCNSIGEFRSGGPHKNNVVDQIWHTGQEFDICGSAQHAAASITVTQHLMKTLNADS